METTKYESRINDLLGRHFAQDNSFIPEVTAFLSATQNVIDSVYGVGSRQSLDLAKQLSIISGNFPTNTSVLTKQSALAKGVLKNTLQEIQQGLIARIETTVSGELLGDFLQLAKVSFEENNGDGGKNVAAVLSAALYEDTIRRMGKHYVGISDRNPLPDIIDGLKAKGVLSGSELTTALGYLKFRNDALHADFESIQRTTVASVIGFVEQLLLRHFS